MTFQQSRTAAALTLLWAGFSLISSGAIHAAPIEIAEVKRDTPVNFQKELLPVLRRKCLACHNSTDAESDLILETPQAILKGGSEGPAAVAGKGAESLILKLAAHQVEPVMPPEDNDVKAGNFSPQELGLLKLWIDQGAKGEVTGAAVEWMPLPPGVNPIYAAAVSVDGQYVAASRANQIFVYHLPSKRELGRLTDPDLLKSNIYSKPGVAMLDLVQSLAFSPDGELLAAGGYKTVKLWRRPRNARAADLAGLDAPARAVAVSADGKWAAFGQENGHIKLFDLSSGKLARGLDGHSAAVNGLAFSADSKSLCSASSDKTLRVWETASGNEIAKQETPAEVTAVTAVGTPPQVVSAGSDNLIRVWKFDPTAETKLESVRELKGHSQPVTSLAKVNDTQVLSGSKDGTARVWDLNNGNAIRTLSHGGPVVAVAVRPDGTRLSTAGSNNVAKLWDAAGKQIAELRGDFRTGIRVAELTRAVNIAKRQTDSAKKDLEEAKKRKTSEEENAKKAAENKKKTEEEFKKKTEAAAKPVADKQAADKVLEQAQAEEKTAGEQQKTAVETATKAGEALTAAQQAQTAANKKATDAANAATQAQQKAQQAEAAAKDKPDDKALADAAAAAKKASEEAQAQAKTAGEAKAKADKDAADALTKKQQADAAKTAADKALQAAQAKTKQAEAKVKQLAGPAQKATDELNAADRAFKAAERSVTRAGESVKKASEAIPVVETEVKKYETLHQGQTTAMQEAQKAVAASEKPLHGIAFSADGTLLATCGDDALLHTWDSETGAAVETYSGHDAVVTTVAFTPDNHIVSAAANNTAIIWQANPQWVLERVIGGADSPELIDRVTALDFTKDGKLLITGGGEPSRSGEIKVWNVADGKLVLELKEPHSDTVFDLDVSPDDQYIASCAADRFVKVFELGSGKFVRSFEGHTHHVLGVGWQAEGRTLASSGADMVVKVWNFRTGDQIRTIPGFKKEVTGLSFVADSINLVVSCGDNTVLMKRSDNGGNVRGFSGATDFVYAVDCSGDGKMIVAGGQDSVLRVWSDNGQVFATFEAPQPEQTAAK